MNLATPALVRYLLRYDLPTNNSCECFASGIAAYLASTSWLYYYETKGGRIQPQCEILDISPAPSAAAKEFAQRFVGAVTVKDPYYCQAFSLSVTLAGAFRRMWPDENRDDWLAGDWAAELGWCMTAEADGSGVAWNDDHPEHDLRYPQIDGTREEFFVNEDAL